MSPMKIDVRDDKGAILSIVAAMVSATLLLAIIALVIDGGVIYSERRVVSNSAESAALSLARICADSPTTCLSSNIPQQFANSNSPDGLTRVTEICVNGKTATTNSCASTGKNSIDCSVPPSGITQFARVRTESQSPDEDSGIKTFFSSGEVKTLIACAQARWGNASSAPSYSPFAVSICEWARQQTLPRVLKEFTTNNGVGDCTYTFTDLAGNTYTKSGINGWAALDLLSTSLPLDSRASVSCPNPVTDKPAYLRIGSQVSQITRDQSSQTYCGDSNLATKMPVWINQTLYLPLVSTKKLTGNSTVHTVEAFAAFKLLGYSLSKGQGSSIAAGGITPTGKWCPVNTNCIYGEFVKTISPNSEINDSPGIPNIGLQAIELF